MGRLRQDSEDRSSLRPWDQNKLALVYFQLGICDYQFGKVTADRSMMQQGQKYSEQSAAMAGPAQAQARQNALNIQRELGAPTGRAR